MSSSAEIEAWEAAVERIRTGMRIARFQKKPTPNEKPEAILKREVYALVIGFLSEGKGQKLWDVIEHVREGQMPHSPSFGENPFHFAFAGLQSPDGVPLQRYQVSRFGRQLLYAWKHQVPPPLLIGFLHQCGDANAIARKVRLNEVETWLGDYQQWLIGNRTIDSSRA